MNNKRILLTLKYTAVMSAVMVMALIIIYLISDGARRATFRDTLRSEAITKANLFLENRVDAETMQHIYLNNTQFINEVEVAVYTPDYQMLYHDAAEHDIVKETPEMVRQICEKGEMSIEVDNSYQAVGILYSPSLITGEGKGGGAFVVTAAAHDGNGEANMHSLLILLTCIFLTSILLMLAVGYYLANITIRPIEHALSSQKMFVSNVSHELRTPLAAITAELDLALSRQRTPEQYQQSIVRSLDDAHRMTHLIDGLLNLAKADYGAHGIAMEPLRIDELLLDAREQLLHAHPDYTINISFDEKAMEADANFSINGNEYLMNIALKNLMENNCKYSANHSSNVLIAIQTSSICITLSDTGEGMTAEEQRNIFQLFYRGSTTRQKGHGIGMALAHKIITLHKGKIEVKSKSGHGTTFSVEIPNE
ncbi:MAG: HAMP domain-containing histidine kinase [Prevotellaceae bacterium]|nr:HAMP domain-containing histidine kinase [Candidatus Minthosoma caballi]